MYTYTHVYIDACSNVAAASSSQHRSSRRSTGPVAAPPSFNLYGKPGRCRNQYWRGAGYLRMYVCIHIMHMYVHTHAHAHAHTRTHTHAHTHTHTHTHTGLTRAAAVLRSKLHGKSAGQPLDPAEPAHVPPLNFSARNSTFRRLGGGQDSRAAQASTLPASHLWPAIAMEQDDDQYFRYVEV